MVMTGKNRAARVYWSDVQCNDPGVKPQDPKRLRGLPRLACAAHMRELHPSLRSTVAPVHHMRIGFASYADAMPLML